MAYQQIALSYQARREILVRLVPRYQHASLIQKRLLLDHFVELTGYSRKHAIFLLNHASERNKIIQRVRLPHYGPEVQQALFLAWKASRYVCAKRLIPFLPKLVVSLETHGRLQLSAKHRHQLLSMSVSTAERYLRTQRKPQIHGLSTTKASPLLKSQIPIRTFAQWDESRPGFLEADLVAHCGGNTGGSFLYTLTLTDVATGWTECLPLLYRSPDTVRAALHQARALFPFPILGLDTDGGGEFINEILLACCANERLTFTRGRTGHKRDQCFVEQKNGAVVREAVSYGHLAGEQAYRQLRELYRALRLHVNCFQPSMKLQAIEEREGQERRVYDPAKTPLQRLLLSGILSTQKEQELREVASALDPLSLTEQLEGLQGALVRSAVPASVSALPGSPAALVRFLVTCSLVDAGSAGDAEAEARPTAFSTLGQQPGLRAEILSWRRSTNDPFEGMWDDILSLTGTSGVERQRALPGGAAVVRRTCAARAPGHFAAPAPPDPRSPPGHRGGALADRSDPWRLLCWRFAGANIWRGTERRTCSLVTAFPRSFGAGTGSSQVRTFCTQRRSTRAAPSKRHRREHSRCPCKTAC